MAVSVERINGNRRISLQELQDGEFQPMEDTRGVPIYNPREFGGVLCSRFCPNRERTDKQTNWIIYIDTGVDTLAYVPSTVVNWDQKEDVHVGDSPVEGHAIGTVLPKRKGIPLLWILWARAVTWGREMEWVCLRVWEQNGGHFSYRELKVIRHDSGWSPLTLGMVVRYSYCFSGMQP